MDIKQILASQGINQPVPLLISQDKRTCPKCKTEYIYRRWKRQDGVEYDFPCEVCEKREQVEKELPGVIEEQRCKFKSQCGLPVIFSDKTFDDFDAKRQPKAFKLMNEWDFSSSKLSVVLSSPGVYGVGKTHLVAALINRMINKPENLVAIRRDGYISRYRCPVYFTTEPVLMARIRHTYDQNAAENEDAVYKFITHQPLLVIDDVGKVKPRDMSFLQSVWFKVLDNRYVNMLPVILTTNLSLNELESHIGGACADRLNEMCGKNIITMSGTSYRIKIAKGE